VLAPGGRICCVVGDVCIPRRKTGRHHLVPLHADIMVRARRVGLDCLTPFCGSRSRTGLPKLRETEPDFTGSPTSPARSSRTILNTSCFCAKGARIDLRRPYRKHCPC
jgi:site-specific DNA-methyltransferase (adenine-specific)